MGKVFNALVKKRMESWQQCSAADRLDSVDRDFSASPSINRRRATRRIHPRAEADWPITIIKNDFPLHGRVKNVSRSGALVYFQEEIAVGEKVLIAIEVEEFSDVITAEAEVVRSYPVIAGINRSTYGVGLKYITISKECLRFFSGNLADAWGEKYENAGLSLKNNILQKLSKDNIVLVIFVVSVALLYFKIEKIEQIHADKIQSLESLIVKYQNSISELDRNVKNVLLTNDKSKYEKMKMYISDLSGRNQSDDWFLLKNQYYNKIFNKKIPGKYIFISENKDQAVEYKQYGIGIGGLKVEDTYTNFH